MIVFISVTVTFLFNICIIPTITYSYWFLIIFFFFLMLKKVLNISNSSVFAWFYFYLKRVPYIFDYFVVYSLLFFKPYTFYQYTLWKKIFKFFEKWESIIITKKCIKVSCLCYFRWFQAIPSFYELCKSWWS